ncbi:protein prenyltransferase alpha subunit repeat containing protein [Pseudozyma hubeiensis SY62]|uniref:Geranylgeranyl transferase type-2 subunit alpha n=1 Tax=Pseudozyma hubeiensis (strain SY62) TaxID=1305764 RepID=R9NWY2_PSEHS|nr:protein prenyltransferase alpha subunit repeat containing protein [Pseudozyma hubeiensis SY62]GAC93012.1 protein prenyltransferase alpha subunit repeat containing protein [Pseudozyma hubeiensis SY62]
MHGVKRQPKTAASAEARAARKAKEASKLAAYLEIERTFFDHKRAARKDTTAFDHTTKLLTLNPELYTVWNYRREVLLHIFEGKVEVEADSKGEERDVFASLREGQVQDNADVAEKDGGEADEERERVERNQQLMEDDLMLTEHALRAHPKVYWIWNHRMWCLTQYPTLPSSSTSTSSTTVSDTWVWERELKLVEKMLDLDPRNFHGWNCRRAITQHLSLRMLSSHPATSDLSSTQPSFPALLSNATLQQADAVAVKRKLSTLAEKELAYTLRKIESNFSNFSAWHQRSQLLPHMWTVQQLDQTQIDLRIDAELELIKQAMYTDPSDQSVWFYHRWLVDLLLAKPSATEHAEGKGRRQRQVKVMQEEIGVIEELFELEPDSKWCALSLAHYNMLLADLYEEGKEREQAKEKAERLLQQLIELDPDREQRYKDLLEGRAHF